MKVTLVRLLDRAQLGAHVLAQLEVERDSGSSSSMTCGLDRERAGDGDALLLAAGKLGDRACRRHPAGRRAPGAPARACGAAALSTPRTSSPKAMFSHTGISGNSARFWKISAVGRLFGPMPRMSCPPMRIAPSVGSVKPEIMPQDRGLAAARGAEEGEELAGLDGK